MKRRRSDGDNEGIQQRSRDVQFCLVKKLQLYLKEIRKNGSPLTAAVAIGAARGLLLAENRKRICTKESNNC